MKPVIDPRRGDVEDDASSSKRRSLLSLAGSLLAEISLPKLAVAWFLLIVGPGLVLGVAPVVAAIWVSKLSTSLEYPIAGIWPLAILALILFPIVWLVSLPLRLIGICFSAVFAIIRTILFLPARLLGWRAQKA